VLAEKAAPQTITKTLVERANANVIQSKKAGLPSTYREKTAKEIKTAFRRASAETQI
jgi:hypothetical protein